METSIELQSKEYDHLAVWPMAPPLYDNRPESRRGPDYGCHVHGYKNGMRTLHGTFDIVIIDGKRFISPNPRL